MKKKVYKTKKEISEDFPNAEITHLDDYMSQDHKFYLKLDQLRIALWDYRKNLVEERDKYYEIHEGACMEYFLMNDMIAQFDKIFSDLI